MRLSKIRIHIHPFAAAGTFLLLFAMPRLYAFGAVSSVLLHEAGHMTAALLLGKRITEIRLMPVGISIGLSAASSYREELLIAAAGPLMNLLYLAAAAIFMPDRVASSVLAASASLAVLNLLPLKSMDGGRIADAVLSPLLGVETSGRILYVTTCACLSVLWMLSLYVFFYSGVNFTLLLFCAYLFSYLIVKKL